MNQTTNAQRSTAKAFASRQLNAEVSASGATSNFKHQTSDIIWRIVDFIVAGIFIYAGALKALDPVQFASDIDNYKILPWPVCVALAFYLPWLEILCGLGLVFRFFYRGALSILTALIMVFILATIAAKVRGLDITCGCFGHASKNWSFTAHLALDLILLAVVISVLGVRRRELAGTS
jgi:putative oxidoreductase